MDILNRIRADYESFPADQSYDLYAPDVYFQDPLNQFRGIDRYRQMIGFMGQWFLDIDLQLHDLQQQGDRLDSRWTLLWTTPLPWKPRIAISGRSELSLNAEGRISSHIDYWDCSIWQVIRQHFFPNAQLSPHNKS